MSERPIQRRAVEVAAIGLVVAAVAACLARERGPAWDFETFYYAALALRHGLDPYLTDSLSAVAGKPVVLPFLYPPGTLALFVPFTWLPVEIATTAWLGFKLALAVALVVLWKRTFLAGTSAPLLLAVAVFGFNAALLWDLFTGNVSVVEQLLLWLGFACYLQGRRWPFAVLVVLASVFKLLPIVFLGLLPAPSKRHGRSAAPLLAGLGLFAAMVFLPSVLGTGGGGRPFGIPANRPFGEVNPCALGLLDIVMGPVWWTGGKWTSWAGTRIPVTDAPDLALAAWGVYVAVVLILSRRPLVRAWRSMDPLRLIVIASMLFALLSPRMMVYSYLLLVVPALHLARDLRPGARAVALLLITLQGVHYYLRRMTPLSIPETPYPVSLALMNLSFFLTLGMWVILLREDARRPGGPARSPVEGRRDRAGRGRMHPARS